MHVVFYHTFQLHYIFFLQKWKSGQQIEWEVFKAKFVSIGSGQEWQDYAKKCSKGVQCIVSLSLNTTLFMKIQLCQNS